MRLLVSVIATVFLVGCQSLTDFRERADVFVANTVPEACTLATDPNLWASYELLLATAEVPQGIQRRVAEAEAVIVSICDDPTKVNSSTALREIIQAYAAFKTAQREAEDAVGD